MPFIEAGNVNLYYEMSGAEDAPAIVLSNSLGTNLHMWDGQVAELKQRFRVLRYDQRGHGRSSAWPGLYAIEQLATDVLRLLDHLRLERAHFCGLSMGGMTGMWLGAHTPSRLNKLVLCNTGAKIGTAELWEARINALREGGTPAVVGAVIERFLSAGFRERNPETTAAVRRMVEETSVEGYAACCEAIRDADLRDALAAIRQPVLVIAGSKDPSTPPADGQYVRDHIRGAQYVELPTAHLSNIEAPAEFNSAVLGFLAAQPAHPGRGV